MSLAQTLDHGWWLASRSAGIVAYVLLSASVVLGLAMALKLAPPRFAALLVTVHERIALLSLAALAAHGLLLLGDGFLRPGIAGILVPFQMSYRPTWTGIGVLAGYLTAGLSLTYYARQRVGARRWRAAHRLIPVAWGMAVAHVIGAGSDAGSLWLQVPLALTMSAVVTLLGYRVLAGRPAPAATTRRPAPVPAPAAAPAQPMPSVPRPVTATPADEAVTTVAPAGGYRPLWARNPAPPPT
ncbi:MAG: methionine sulfoxide reductase heme-binding subunit [Solirubrobacteraceae bacterium]|nr:methionine sulfoxide reductase heme-binding subunit [Solirubrobacteraceae bacterium]